MKEEEKIIIKEIGKIESVNDVPYSEDKKIAYMGWKIFKNHVRIIVSTTQGRFDFRGSNGSSFLKVKKAVYEMIEEWRV